MVTKLIKIGNSNGVILSKAMLKQAGITTEADISITNKGIVITPVQMKAKDKWVLEMEKLPKSEFKIEEDLKDWLEFDIDFDLEK